MMLPFLFAFSLLVPHKAVVNPVMPRDEARVVSLRGEWDFVAMHRWPRRNASFAPHFHLKDRWEGERKITVPGCWEAQGVGKTNEWGKSWECHWDAGWKHVRNKHLGEGWYRKSVDVPREWKGKRVWIAIGAVNSQGWVWVNGREVAYLNDWCGTYRFDVTDYVRPGERAKIVIEVDNSLPSKKGVVNYVHKWGGILRDVELQATEDAWFEDVWFTADKNLQPVLHYNLGGSTNGVRVVSSIGQPDSPAAEKFSPWSPEAPNLHTARVDLVSADGRLLERRYERFGLKRFEVRGEKFYLNGKPLFVRGFGDDAVYPLTGVSPADKDYHKAHLRKAKELGFNAVRTHTHCEWPEYYEAADEVGILIEAELPYYGDMPTDHFDYNPLREARELYEHYRRFASYAITSGCNEGGFGREYSKKSQGDSP